MLHKLWDCCGVRVPICTNSSRISKVVERRKVIVIAVSRPDIKDRYSVVIVNVRRVVGVLRDVFLT